MIDIGRRKILGLLTAVSGGLIIGRRAFAAAGAAKETTMHTRAIPTSGERLPVIGLGTWQTFDVGSADAVRAPLRDVLHDFVELGGRVVDSSPMYGRSESVLGELAAELGVRDRLFLATKVWTSGEQAGIEQMRASLRRLGAERLDLMQVHNLVDVDTHLDTLQEWQWTGRVRYVGVTHYHAGAHDDVIRLMTERPLDFVQINYSVGERAAEQRLLPLALERGVAVIANRPFAGGNLFRRLRERPLPAWADEIECESWAQIMLKFVVSHPAVTCAIPATSNPKHLRDNMRAGYGPMPGAELRARIATEIGTG